MRLKALTSFVFLGTATAFVVIDSLRPPLSDSPASVEGTALSQNDKLVLAAAPETSDTASLQSHEASSSESSLPQGPQTLTFRLSENTDFVKALLEEGFPSHTAERARAVLAEVSDLKFLGQSILVNATYKNDSGEKHLSELNFVTPDQQAIVLRRDDKGNFSAQKQLLAAANAPKHIMGTIQTSLYVDASKNGVPVSVINDVSRGLSYEVHLQRDLQPDSPFEILYETSYDPQTKMTRPGPLLYAALRVHGKTKKLYRYTDSSSHADLYNEKGESLRKSLLMTPIAAARLSSPFGNRKHPIFGFSRLHRGVDFAAPIGTPVVAAGDGVVSFAGRKGGYGNYIRVTHPHGYQTVYAHLRNFAKNLRSGMKVRQGQVLGYVGNSGISTGAHLHHEVIFAGKHINPQAIRQTSKVKLTGQELRRFLAFKKRVDTQTSGLEAKTQLALADNAIESRKSQL